MTTTTRSTLLLVAVVGALLFTLAADIYGALVTKSSTEDLVNDAFRSVSLVEDLRRQVHTLAAHELGAPRDAVLGAIDRDVRDYAPLATYEDEGAVWAQLQAQLGPLRDALARGDLAAAAIAAQRAGDLADQLVDINVRSAGAIVTRISQLRRREIMIDVVVVLVAVVLLTRIGVGVNRAQRREAALVARNLAMVQAQNRELEAFAGRAAHDLRAPLSPIRGFADLIATGNDAPDEMRRMGAVIAKGVNRMSRVIDDMLELSRSGHAVPGSAPLRAVAAAVVEELAPELRDAQVQIDVDDVIVGCGETALEQILRNLIGNSAKYRSPERRLEVVLRGQRDGDRVRLEVADNGTGMDAASAAHAFDPFFRGRADVAGTGLGLAIVERIARAYGGSCALDAARPQGMAVAVVLPLAPAP
ncbi:MAG: HAMP domain-containing histidine kinase [Deltaproteobacteria bacterium]|nr:HAMP domain-containing histidine kinase [Deltaproteobacteria bacterium]